MVQREQLEVALLVTSCIRLVAGLAKSAAPGATWHAIGFAVVNLLALIVEFSGATALASPYRLRRCDSQGLAQGVLAVPSVLAALAVAAPTGPWLGWLACACAAAGGLAVTTGAQSAQLIPTAARTKATAADAASEAVNSCSDGGSMPTNGSKKVDADGINKYRKHGSPNASGMGKEVALVAAAAAASAAVAALAAHPLATAVLWGGVGAPALYLLLMPLLPCCFSIGEGALAAQGVALLSAAALLAAPHAACFVPAGVWALAEVPAAVSFHSSRCGGGQWAATAAALPSLVPLVLSSALLCCFCLRGVVGALHAHRKAPAAGRALCITAAAAAVAAPAAAWLASAAAWTLFDFVPAAPGRITVLAYWAVTLAVTLPAMRLLPRHMPQIIVRKGYHILAGALFVPAFFWDLPLLCHSLGVAFAALVALEALRVSRVPGLGAGVQAFMQEFVDERDSGAIYVTHFTLLLGLAVPMWLIASALPGDDASSTLRAVVGGLSGVVIVGVGDTAASLVGKLFGRRPVHAGSRKTLEGMVAGVVGSLVAWVALIEGVGLSSDVHLWQLMQWWGQLVAATAGAGLMEACTSQLDNVLLPLWYLPHLLLVSP